ncbi:MAG: DNA cytosine methyltransferase [Chloroflexi bacterium]|nr:DNA cytosine methyltransferase [Chloroflexota bacterium]
MRDKNWIKEPPKTAVDLFCGCGSVSKGLQLAGFNVQAAVDNDPTACSTYRSNHPDVILFERDIRDICPTEMLRILGGSGVDLLAICAPCQPFSSHGNRDADDDRTRLILESIRFAEILRPKLVFFENVPGIFAPRFERLLGQLAAGLNSIGYVLGRPKKLDAARFGVPQRRVRYFMLARIGRPPPELPDMTMNDPVSVAEAIGDLNPLESGQSDIADVLHFARNHREIAIRRMRHIPKNGGSRNSLPRRLQLACHRSHRGHPDVYGRMRWEDVAPTLTTGCTDLTRGRFGHPRDDRAITLREAARLQTFPDDYLFRGSAKHVATQIGNAVPVKLVAALGPTLLMGTDVG